MPDFNQEIKDQNLDATRESSDECVDGSVGLVDRTQQLLDEVDQLLGGQSAPDADDLNDDSVPPESVDTLKKFLSELGESDPKSEEETELDPTPDQEGQLSTTAEDDDDSEFFDSADEDVDFSRDTDVESETESTLESGLDTEDDHEIDLDEDARSESDAHDETNTGETLNLDNTTSELEFETTDYTESDVESEEDSSESTGFDLESIKRAFAAELEAEAAEEEADKATELPTSESEAETTPSNEVVPEPFSTESWIAENLDAIAEETDEHAANDEAVSAFESDNENFSQPSSASEQGNPQFAETIDSRLSQIETSMDRMFQQLENRIEGMFANLSEQVKCLSISAQSAERAGDFSEQIHEDTIQPTIGNANIEETVDEQVDDKEQIANPEQDSEDSDKIKALKEQLTSKLREAEIELSINRAKLSQQKATIEQMQSDLSRREAALEDKLDQAKKMGLDKKKGLLNRWKRHMGDDEE